MAEAKAYIDSLPTVDLNLYDLRRLRRNVEGDVERLRDLYDRSGPLAAQDAKIEELKRVPADELRGEKVLIFSSFKDTSRYVHQCLTSEDSNRWRESMGDPVIRRIDSGEHPSERQHILRRFAPIANKADPMPDEQITILTSTDVLSEWQNLQDCGVTINYDLTWNPVRLVQRKGRIDRIGSAHETITIYNPRMSWSGCSALLSG